jgi:hypothetical protein
MHLGPSKRRGTSPRPTDEPEKVVLLAVIKFMHVLSRYPFSLWEKVGMRASRSLRVH